MSFINKNGQFMTKPQIKSSPIKPYNIFPVLLLKVKKVRKGPQRSTSSCLLSLTCVLLV
jgi:hypothetical protein